MKIYVSILIYLSLASLSVAAQHDLLEIDSLKKVLSAEKEDTNKVKTLRHIAGLYWKFNSNQALQYENYALNVAKQMGLQPAIADCYYTTASIMSTMDNTVGAIQNLYKALQIYQGLNNNLNSGDCLSFIGFEQFGQANYDEAYNDFSKALKVLQQADSLDNFPGALCYLYLAKIFIIQQKFQQASEYNTIGLKISKKISHLQLQANAYSSSGDIILKQLLLEKSIPINKSALQKAKKQYLQSLKNFKDYGDIYGGAGDEYSNLAFIDILLNNLIEAQKYADSALQCAKGINFKDNFRESYLVQYQIDSTKGNYTSAFSNYKKYILYRDSITNEENVKKNLQSSLQYEFDKKEVRAKAEQDKKDANAKRIKNRQYFAITALGIIVLAVLIIALIQFRNNKQKQRANVLLERQKQKVESTLQELKSTQSQLIQSEKMASLGELTAGIAHEIQNPLNFVNNFSDINTELIDELTSELITGSKEETILIAKDIKDNEIKINHHGKRADSIVKGMLLHSRASSGQKEPVNINTLVDEYLRLSYHGLRAKDKAFNVTLTTDFDKTIGNISIVPQDIGRVLLNLYNNAFYAVNEKKQSMGNNYEPIVSVSTSYALPPGEGRGEVQVKVKDNGIGIPQKVVDKIFQPFFTTKPTGEGTGLGLSLSYDIIKAHGGGIKVITEEGGGTEFIIKLPANA